jgi:hypothetical protein
MPDLAIINPRHKRLLGRSDLACPIRATLSHLLDASFIWVFLKNEKLHKVAKKANASLTVRPAGGIPYLTSLLFASAAGRGAAPSGAAPAFFKGRRFV